MLFRHEGDVGVQFEICIGTPIVILIGRFIGIVFIFLPLPLGHLRIDTSLAQYGL